LAAIVCHALTKRFGTFTALDGLDLNVEENAIFGFLGPNGAGKTTCLKILTGLSRPTSGTASVAGESVALNCQSLQGKIGYLPEEPAFYNWMTGKEYLTFVGDLLGLPSKEAGKRTGELLQLMDLSGASSRKIGGYSRGMKQRLGIAQALMNHPSVLFLDEPCSALDPVGRAELLDILAHLKDGATTVFMSSHILADVERICDHVAIIDKGKLVVQAGVQELRQRFAPPILELEFEEPADSFRQKIQSMPWAENVQMANPEGTRLRVKARDLAQARNALPRMAADSGLTLRHYLLVVPTLEEVFIELTDGKKAQ
jgi:ABC-2 type transport system ATP-binding protein